MFDVKDVRLPSCAGPVSLEASYLQWPPGGCKACWSMPHLFVALGLSSYEGSVVDWCHARKPSLDKHCRQWTSESHFFMRFYHLDGVEAWRTVGRIFPKPSVTTFAMLAFVSRWCVLSPRQGGLRSAERPERLHAFLAALLRKACDDVFDMQLRFDPQWRPPWPLPEFSDRPCLTLTVIKDGVLNVSPWAEKLR